MPHEQLEFLTNGINSSVLTDEFKRDVLRILDEEDMEYYYRTGIIKR